MGAAVRGEVGDARFCGNKSLLLLFAFEKGAFVQVIFVESLIFALLSLLLFKVKFSMFFTLFVARGTFFCLDFLMNDFIYTIEKKNSNSRFKGMCMSQHFLITCYFILFSISMVRTYFERLKSMIIAQKKKSYSNYL